MATKTIAWGNGNGNITLNYSGSGNGTITVTSDMNNLAVARSKTITLKTADGKASKTITVSQAAISIAANTIEIVVVNNTSSSKTYQEKFEFRLMWSESDLWQSGPRVYESSNRCTLEAGQTKTYSLSVSDSNISKWLGRNFATQENLNSYATYLKNKYGSNVSFDSNVSMFDTNGRNNDGASGGTITVGMIPGTAKFLARARYYIYLDGKTAGIVIGGS